MCSSIYRTQMFSIFTFKGLVLLLPPSLLPSKLYCEGIIFTMDWALMGDKLDWQKLCHASCFCSSLSVKASYTEITILLAASLASGSLSFNKSAAIWTNAINPISFIPSSPCQFNHTNFNLWFPMYFLKVAQIGRQMKSPSLMLMENYQLGDTFWDRNGSLGSDSGVSMVNIRPELVKQRQRSHWPHHCV